MLTLFITSTIPPIQMDDDGLERHIQVLFFQIESILLEMKSSWNKPDRAQAYKILRKQLADASAQLSAAQEVYIFRLESMR